MEVSDRLNIIIALREVATALETKAGDLDSRELLKVVGTEMLVLALRDEMQPIDDLPEPLAEKLMRRELSAILHNIARFHKGHVAEGDVLTERLVRLYDPYLAWNEAINRAMERMQKDGVKLDPGLLTPSPQQKWMFEKFQLPTTYKALKASAEKVIKDAVTAAEAPLPTETPA